MLYHEFLEGTEARDSAYNCKIYKAVEALYMAVDEMEKEDAYELGRKYIDNEYSEDEKRLLHYLELTADEYSDELEELQDLETCRLQALNKAMADGQDADAIQRLNEDLDRVRRDLYRNEGARVALREILHDVRLGRCGI